MQVFVKYILLNDSPLGVLKEGSSFFQVTSPDLSMLTLPYFSESSTHILGAPTCINLTSLFTINIISTDPLDKNVYMKLASRKKWKTNLSVRISVKMNNKKRNCQSLRLRENSSSSNLETV